MKWKCRKPGTRERALHWWHDWFAWFPVRVPTKGRRSGQKMVWLETVRRKRNLHIDREGYMCTYEYREKGNDK